MCTENNFQKYDICRKWSFSIDTHSDKVYDYGKETGYLTGNSTGFSYIHQQKKEEME